MTPRMTYREYLVWTAAHTAAALNDAIRTAMDMGDEYYAVRYLEQKLDVARELVKYSRGNPDVVGPRPTEPDEEVG